MTRSGSGRPAVSSRSARSSCPIASASRRPSRTSIASRRAASTISCRRAVIESHRQREPSIAGGQHLRLVDERHDVGREIVPFADDPAP